MTITDCDYEDLIWQNDRHEDRNMLNQRFSGTVIGDEVPHELSDPEWLANELDGTNELIRALEAGQIEDVGPANGSSENEDYATRKLREWEELAGGKEWWQW